jgi:hypothetical protein
LRSRVASVVIPRALRDGHNSGISTAKGQVTVLLDKLDHPSIVVRRRIDRHELADREEPQKRRLDGVSGSGCEKVANLGNHERRHDQLIARVLEEVPAGLVVSVVSESGRY